MATSLYTSASRSEKRISDGSSLPIIPNNVFLCNLFETTCEMPRLRNLKSVKEEEELLLDTFKQAAYFGALKKLQGKEKGELLFAKLSFFLVSNPK